MLYWGILLEHLFDAESVLFLGELIQKKEIYYLLDVFKEIDSLLEKK